MLQLIIKIILQNILSIQKIVVLLQLQNEIKNGKEE